VTRGPLVDRVGLYSGMSGRDRVRVMFQMFEREVSIDLREHRRDRRRVKMVHDFRKCASVRHFHRRPSDSYDDDQDNQLKSESALEPRCPSAHLCADRRDGGVTTE
jgi:hypothetical protein